MLRLMDTLEEAHHQDDPLAHLAVRGAQLAEVLAPDLADEVTRAQGECLRAQSARGAPPRRGRARPAVVLDLMRTHGRRRASQR